MEKLGVLIIRDLAQTSQELAGSFLSNSMQMGDPLPSIHQVGSQLFISSLDRSPQHCSPNAHVLCLCTDDHILDSQRLS